MSETNVKTVKKIKKVVVTEDTRHQTFGIDTEFKSDNTNLFTFISEFISLYATEPPPRKDS